MADQNPTFKILAPATGSSSESESDDEGEGRKAPQEKHQRRVNLSRSSGKVQRIGVVEAILASVKKHSKQQLEKASKVTCGSLSYAARIWSASGSVDKKVRFSGIKHGSFTSYLLLQDGLRKPNFNIPYPAKNTHTL